MHRFLIIALFFFGCENWEREAAQDIKRFEGWRSKIYYDQFGTPTIGWGRNLKEGISKEEGQRMFEQDLKTAVQVCHKVVDDFEDHPGSVKRGLVNMAFELGEDKFSEFKIMLEALRHGEYVKAGEEVLKSDFGDEVTGRAEYIAHLIAQAGDGVIEKARMEALKFDRHTAQKKD